MNYISRNAEQEVTVNTSPLPASSARSDEGIKSLSKLMKVLDCFSTSVRTLSLSEVCQRTGFPKSTTHRLLASLREAGLLDQEGDRDRYRLGLKLFELGNTVLANMDLHREARPYVDALGRLSGQSVHLAVFDGHHAVVVGRSDAHADAGARAFFESAPAHCTSVGKAILAFQNAATLDRFVSGELARFTEHTLTDPKELLADLKATRERGYSIDEGEHQPGLRCVGAPIRDASGRVFAALSVSGPAWKLPLSEVESTAKIVIHSANAISQALGGSS
ncbi:transcriptional regulator, IclR family [Faunimonas pinastri]|uniref:Transcriptional regulator, IclR family n=2 Tax=Faunimonas pinastri TaxID=1855383 RepID=A0A1H9EFU1_9HYPH|nr:transcriptional regulator, IclR family [Faunimonas pinastri]